MLEGDASQTASRQHARIDLAAGRATLTDLGSSNGTLLNGEKINAPRPLRIGDRIQCGYTGATLTVLELDLQTAPVAAPSPPQSRRVAVILGVAACVLVAAGVLFVNALRQRAPAEVSPGQESGQPAERNPVAVSPPTKDTKATGEGKKDKDDPKKLPNGEPKKPTIPDGAPEVKVGDYIVLKEWGPSILLGRRGEGLQWARFRPDAAIRTSQTLMCLPGYRAHLQLGSGVHLTLWGNVPEFCSFPPSLLESVVMLKAPDEEGVDLDLILIRGRVHLANTKKHGAARIRLRFLHETWEVTLPDSSGEVCAELWSALRQPTEKGERRALPLALGLFSKGRVTVRTEAQTIDLQDRMYVSWMNEAGSQLARGQWDQLPTWWTKHPVASNPREADVMVSLKDWDERLREPGNFLQEVFKHCAATKKERAAAKEDDPTFRELGVYFLGAFDGESVSEEGISLVVRLLEDEDDAEVRRAAAHVLRAWLARNALHGARLTPILQARLKARTDPGEKAAVVQRLLYPYDGEVLNKPAEWKELREKLLASLDDENIAVRELAAWHLEELAGAKGVQGSLTPYNATAPDEERRKAIRQWEIAIR
jgi:hypothetical protein